MKKWLIAAACAVSISAGAYTLHSGEGDSVKVHLSTNIVLNGQSTLKRENHVIRDAAAPLEIKGEPGVYVGYHHGERGIGGSYHYQGSFGFTVREPVLAVEYVVVVFDVFGRRLDTLRGSMVADWEPGGDYRVNPQWRIHSEAVAKESYSSMVYVRSVRTKAGKVYTADLQRIGELARKVSTQVKDADLVTERPDK